MAAGSSLAIPLKEAVDSGRVIQISLGRNRLGDGPGPILYEFSVNAGTQIAECLEAGLAPTACLDPKSSLHVFL